MHRTEIAARNRREKKITNNSKGIATLIFDWPWGLPWVIWTTPPYLHCISQPTAKLSILYFLFLRQSTSTDYLFPLLCLALIMDSKKRNDKEEPKARNRKLWVCWWAFCAGGLQHPGMLRTHYKEVEKQLKLSKTSEVRLCCHWRLGFRVRSSQWVGSWRWVFGWILTGSIHIPQKSFHIL